VQALTPGFRGAEGKEKSKGVMARWRLEEAQSKSAGQACPGPRSGEQNPDMRCGTLDAALSRRCSVATSRIGWNGSLRDGDSDSQNMPIIVIFT
jgi:hypothetical protein